jgi:hypothetical protein
LGAGAGAGAARAHQQPFAAFPCSRRPRTGARSQAGRLIAVAASCPSSATRRVRRRRAGGRGGRSGPAVGRFFSGGGERGLGPGPRRRAPSSHRAAANQQQRDRGRRRGSPTRLPQVFGMVVRPETSLSLSTPPHLTLLSCLPCIVTCEKTYASSSSLMNS